MRFKRSILDLFSLKLEKAIFDALAWLVIVFAALEICISLTLWLIYSVMCRASSFVIERIMYIETLYVSLISYCRYTIARFSRRVVNSGLVAIFN